LPIPDLTNISASKHPRSPIPVIKKGGSASLFLVYKHKFTSQVLLLYSHLKSLFQTSHVFHNTLVISFQDELLHLFAVHQEAVHLKIYQEVYLPQEIFPH